MTFDEWWSDQPTRFVAAGYKEDAREIWEAATKAEREACAKVCDDHPGNIATNRWSSEAALSDCADRIRMRSNA